MKTITGDYWSDLNSAINDAFKQFENSITAGQKRDLALFLIHVLENEKGISEIELRFRANFERRTFNKIKDLLKEAGLIRITAITALRIDNIVPADEIKYLVRKSYYLSGRMCSDAVPKPPGDTHESRRKSADTIYPQKRKETIREPGKAVTGSEERKNAPERKFPSFAASREIKEDKPREKIKIQTIINKAQIRKVQELIEKGKKTDLKKLFEEWKIEYTEESVDRLKFYLEKNSINFSIDGSYPKMTLAGREL